MPSAYRPGLISGIRPARPFRGDAFGREEGLASFLRMLAHTLANAGPPTEGSGGPLCPRRASARPPRSAGDPGAPRPGRLPQGQTLVHGACLQPPSSPAELPMTRRPTLLVFSLAWLALSACEGVGPATLGAGRGAYNDVIARTNSEQMLALIVRLR